MKTVNRAFSALVRLAFVFSLFVLVFVLTLGTILPQFGSTSEMVQAQARDVELNKVQTRSKMYDRYGNEIDLLYNSASNREWVELDDIAPQVGDAVVAIEDANFYQHEGVNVKAIARAAVENVGAGGISQGGSTITQQLIKNRVLTSETTISRKVTEAAMALRLEDELSKDEILEQYLNTVYFGHGAYGVLAAAEMYWGKEPDELDWPEAALLASVIRLPDGTDPIRFPETAREQRSIALGRLAELGYITEDEARIYERAPLPVQEQSTIELPKDDYFTDQVRQILMGKAEHVDYPFQRWLKSNPDIFGTTEEERISRVGGLGLRIYTTWDRDVQAQQEKALEEILPPNDRGFTMAFASVEPATGAVAAIVGGPGFDNFEFNIATSVPGRQPGSSFKPFVMATAYEQKYLPIDQIDGSGPCNFPDAGSPNGTYTVNNFANSQGSAGSIIQLTQWSSNCGFVRMGQIVGIENVIDMARRLGLENAVLGNYKSLPLGSAEVSPLEMASAYSTLANDGVRNEPYFIERIENDAGEVVYEHNPTGKRVVKSDVACYATATLANNFEAGTGKRANNEMPYQPAAGKTGTTEDFGDAWFVGYTPYLATAVWMGNPDSNAIKMTGVGGESGVTGGSFPAQAWGRFNAYYHEDKEVRNFSECSPYPRGGRYVLENGQFGSARGCSSSSPFPVDSDLDGSYDRCSADVSNLYVCGLSGAYDQNGQALPLYCASGPSPGSDQLNQEQLDQQQLEQQQLEQQQLDQQQQQQQNDQTQQQLNDQQPAAPEIAVWTGPNGAVYSCDAQRPFGVDTDGDGYFDHCTSG